MTGTADEGTSYQYIPPSGNCNIYLDVGEPPEPEPPEPDAAPPAPPPPEPVAGAVPVPIMLVSERVESGVVTGEPFIDLLSVPKLVLPDELSFMPGETDVESASLLDEVPASLHEAMQKTIAATRVINFMSGNFKCVIK